MIRLYRSVCHALVWWLQKSNPRWSDCHPVISYKMIKLPSNQQLIKLSFSHQMLILLSEIITLSSTHHMIMSYSVFLSVITWSDIQDDQMVVQPSDDDIIILLSDDQMMKLSSSYQMIRLHSCHPRWSDCAAPSVTPCCLVTSKTSSSNCFQLLGCKPCLHTKPN